MRKLLSVTLFIFLLACHLPVNARTLFAEDSSKEEESLFVAKKAFEDGFYEVSLDLLERFLKSYPDSSKAAEAKLLIGRSLYHQNRFLDALAKFEELYKDPGAGQIKDASLYWIAEVHFKGNNFDKAALYYKRVWDEFPKSSYAPSAYYSLGWCLFQEQKFREAAEIFKTVEEKYPRESFSQDASFKLLECLYNLKDYSALREKLKNYLKLFARDAPRLAYLYFYMAEAQYYLDNFAEAQDWYAKVLSSTRDERLRGLSELGQAWSYLKLKRYKEAENKFLEVSPGSLEKRSNEVLLLGKAILMVETNRVHEAKKLYEGILKEADDPLVLIQAYLGKADCHYNLAEYAEAIAVYNEALKKINPALMPQEISDKLHYNLSWAYLKQGEFKDAIREFQKIVKTSDDKIIKVSALCQIGDTYQDSGDYQKAKEAYDAILKDYPDSSYADYVQYQLGLTLLKSSNYDAAILCFLNFKRNYPASKLSDDATYALGLAYFQRQDYDSSRQTFARFQEEYKESILRPQALYLFGTSLYNLEKYSEAINVFREISRQYSQDKELAQKAEYEIADCYYQLGDEKEAMNRFKALRSKYPDSSLTAEIMWWLGEYYYRHNKLDLAQRYFLSLIQDFPRSNLVPEAHYALGSIYEEESRYADAVASFKEVGKSGKTDLAGQAAIAVADIYAREGKTDEALSAYRQTVKDYPNLAGSVYPKMADLFLKINYYNDALELYRKSLDIVPVKEVGMIQLKIAEALEAKGEPDVAIEEYLKVTYLYSDDPGLSVKALLRVAEIYENLDKMKEALNIYKKVVAMNTEEAKYARERIDWITEHTK
ncbi:MAG: tetratricopeptide repeat protein [Candidatus Omnitrophica bacterium]|nr:tetratricopeptide repeat protein [Candidatus Omnitrophota bacterium]